MSNEQLKLDKRILPTRENNPKINIGHANMFCTIYGMPVVTFDGKSVYDLFHDYPWALTSEEREIFQREELFWANYFKNRDPDNPPEGFVRSYPVNGP